MPEPKDFTILVVDDEESLRNAVIFDFKRKGFNVYAAENGVRAYEVVQTTKIDLILSDIRMPGGDGLKLLEQIQSVAEPRPIVFLFTGFADITEAECITRGAREVIAKPFDRKALMKSVFTALNLAPPA